MQIKTLQSELKQKQINEQIKNNSKTENLKQLESEESKIQQINSEKLKQLQNILDQTNQKEKDNLNIQKEQDFTTGNKNTNSNQHQDQILQKAKGNQKELQDLQLSKQNLQEQFQQEAEDQNITKKQKMEKRKESNQSKEDGEKEINQKQQENSNQINNVLLQKQLNEEKQNKSKQEEKVLPQPLQKDIQLKQIYSRKSLNTYSNEYKHNENIKKVVLELQQKFDSYRSVRGDGNWYFRAVGFAFLEHLLRYTTPVQHLQDFISKLESDRGYYQIRPNNINNSHQILKQTFLRLLNNLKDLKEQNQKFLQQQLTQELENNKDKQDEALVWQMRCLTANYLESHREYFEPFCQISYEQLVRDVLTMGKEADGLGIGPLQVVLKAKIDIITIDRNYAEALQFDQMKIAGKCPQIFILYKPGHYDIIYSKEQSNVDGFDDQSEQYQEIIRL